MKIFIDRLYKSGPSVERKINPEQKCVKIAKMASLEFTYIGVMKLGYYFRMHNLKGPSSFVGIKDGNVRVTRFWSINGRYITPVLNEEYVIRGPK